MDMAHLRPEARDLALLPANERLARMPANRWIGYTRASQAITLLEQMLAASVTRQRELLNLLRYIGNELCIPLTCLGTREAYLAIRTDDSDGFLYRMAASHLTRAGGLRTPRSELLPTSGRRFELQSACAWIGCLQSHLQLIWVQLQ